MDISDRQRVRLLVKDVLVDDDTITIRRSIPVQSTTLRPAAMRYPATAKRRCPTEVTYCDQGVISPLLANIFVHYVHDPWAFSPNTRLRSDRALLAAMIPISRWLRRAALHART
ncbi:hypothetical protein [Mesorhizobium silamurunense]|uniref:hypothetical protein n=1 Tax=Mesorhizobium silamurunense TaxID=499528 RepID=UPI00177B62D0|nr:hypothetical protein [Mesorhizobium silamurunense]